MAQEIITLECTEARALGKPVSRYMTTRNKKSPQTPNRLEKKIRRAVRVRLDGHQEPVRIETDFQIIIMD